MKFYPKNIAVPILVSLFVAVGLYGQIPTGYQTPVKSIDAKNIEKHLRFFSSDSLKGRPAGSEENLVAARYIAAKFRENGLKPLLAEQRGRVVVNDDSAATEQTSSRGPANANDSFFQKFSIKRAKLSDSNALVVSSDEGNAKVTVRYQYGKDLFIQYKRGESISLSAPVVFAGYGIAKGEAGYNDYVDAKGKELDVKNKFVMVIDGFPRELDSTSAFVRARNAYYRNPLRKADVAQEKGALGLLVIGSTKKQEPPVDIKYENMASGMSREFDFLPDRPSRDIPIMYLGKNIVEEMFKGTNNRLDSLQDRIDQSLQSQAFEVQRKTVTGEINFTSSLIQTQNVIGWIEGTDSVLRNEVLVLGAHYDHVGLGYYGAMSKSNIGQIHNGADDNASGSSALLELARVYGMERPKRSVLFIAFGAEENGLLGSRYYVYEQPLKPLKQTVAMLNHDMIGRNEHQIVYIGGAFQSDDLTSIVKTANEQVGMALLYNVGLLSNASDQAPFLRRQIPAAFFFTGLHDDYHTPSDDADKIDFKKIENIVKLSYITGWILANQSSKPVYRELSMEERKSLIEESKVRREQLFGNPEKK